MSNIAVMLVDDSAVTRGILRRIIDNAPDIDVKAQAANGRIAIDVLKRNPDIQTILLDIEMPEMDGITALPELLKINPDVNVLMVSTLTHRGADVSFRALRLGAKDYVPKPSTTADQSSVDSFSDEILAKIRALSAPKPKVTPVVQTVTTQQSLQQPATAAPVLRKATSPYAPHALAFGSSTGGPQALGEVFRQLKHAAAVPIFISQHMPPAFTAMLAKHLDQASVFNVAEAQDGEVVVPGRVYVAPGGYHMTAKRHGNTVKISLNQDEPEHYCRPSVNPMLRSLAKVYGSKLTAIILTGMGSDGLEGCQKVASNGGTVIAQDAASCTVYGMPKAVTDAGICNEILPLSQIGTWIERMWS